jgi:8-oxo-dGTP pyrophosphatase MutT (NUDIX family)
VTLVRGVAYVLRERELLVFEQEQTARGLEVPAGRLEPGESLRDAIVREVREEAGVEAEFVQELGKLEDVAPRYGEVRVNHFVAMRTDDPRSSWSHAVTGSGDEVGLVFNCRFVPLDAPLELRPPQGAFLHRL